MMDAVVLTATTIYSTTTDISRLAEATICCDITGTPVGTLSVECQSGDSAWRPVGTLSVSVTGATNETFQLNTIPGERLRVKWVGTSSTGVITATITGKGV